MPSARRAAYNGPALFSVGFRPFFAGAIVFATGAVLVWMLVFSGQIELASPFPAIDWHIHEMLFGYGAAVISGFLFTAIPNWTGRMPVRGWPLAGLAALWLAGRLVMAGGAGLGGIAVMAVDCAFLAGIGLMVTVEIVAGRNWRNLKVIVPVLLLLGANILFHVEVLTRGGSDYGRRMGVSVVILLIMLIGGRIVPSFTRNWLVKRNPGALPVPFGRFDALCLAAGAAALALWTIVPGSLVAGAALLLAAGLHLARLARWQGGRTLASPLLVMLHLAYAFIPLGLAACALAAPPVGFHLLGIGAIGGMTMAVMMRATLGHSGRKLVASKGLTLAFALVLLAALVRGFVPGIDVLGVSGLWIAALLWTLAYGIVLVRIGPLLVRARPARPVMP